MLGRRLASCLLLLLSTGALGGCFMPRGTPVAVDRNVDRIWSGDGVLLETSPDAQRCRVALRNSALIVEKRWLSCVYVHRRLDRRYR